MTVAGVLVAAGLVGLVAAVKGVSIMPPRSARSSRSKKRQFRPMYLVAVAAGVLILLITGWPVAALATAAAVVFIPQVSAAGSPRK